MDKLNLAEIEKKLNSVFNAGERLVFWYDKTGHFEDDIEDLNLGSVKVLRLTDRNAFRTKMIPEHEDPEGRYLIYAPFAKPPVAKNHLENTLLYSQEFFADKLSLISADLGIPMRLRSALSGLTIFFGAGEKKLTKAAKTEADKRTNDFIDRMKEVDVSTADEELIRVIG